MNNFHYVSWVGAAHLESNIDIYTEIFTNYFECVEGRTCSRDKARYTTKMLLKSMNEGVTYSLTMTYRDCKDRGNISDDDLDKRCYWCPMTLDDTEDAFTALTMMINPRHVDILMNNKKAIYSARQAAFALKEKADKIEKGQ